MAGEPTNDETARVADLAAGLLKPIDLNDVVAVFEPVEAELDERILTKRPKEAGRLASGFTDRWTVACLEAAQAGGSIAWRTSRPLQGRQMSHRPIEQRVGGSPAGCCLAL